MCKTLFDPLRAYSRVGVPSRLPTRVVASVIRPPTYKHRGRPRDVKYHPRAAADRCVVARSCENVIRWRYEVESKRARGVLFSSERSEKRRV